MCDDSGTIYAIGGLEDIQVEWDDLDEETKRELLSSGFGPSAPATKSPDPGCRWCRGTGKLRLLVSETECDCVR